jgi:hypothetical protein
MPDRFQSLSLGAPKLLVPEFTLPNALPGSATWTSPFTSTSPGRTELTLIQLVGLAAATVTIHKVPPGGAAANSNKITAALAVGLGETMDIYWDSPYVVPAGYTLWCFASAANSINCGIHGVDYA